MYKIEWKKQLGSVYNSVYIDGQMASTGAVRYAEHANLLESKLKQLINDLSDEWNDYLNDSDVKPLIEDKWITELEAELILENKVILTELISTGELSFTMIGNERKFDRNDLVRIKRDIII
jgi:hypothetical protein